MVRINAATHLLNRIDGLPVAKVVSAEVDDLSRMMIEELQAERERILPKRAVARDDDDRDD